MYLGTKSIQDLVDTKALVLPIKEKRIKYGAYELSLGTEVFQTDSKSGKKDILKEDGEQIIIKPGQFALLLTEEVVDIPKNMIGFISIKAGIKLKGLINVSGFHVDPGFNGKLVFSVYNAGPATIILEKGEAYFPMWLSQLNETNNYNGNHENQQNIPTKYIEALASGELASPNALLARLKENEEKLANIKGVFAIIITLFITFITIAITITTKIYSENQTFKNGVEYGRKEAKIDSLIKKSLRIYPTDSLSSRKIDSILNERIKIIMRSK